MLNFILLLILGLEKFTLSVLISVLGKEKNRREPDRGSRGAFRSGQHRLGKDCGQYFSHTVTVMGVSSTSHPYSEVMHGYFRIKYKRGYQFAFYTVC